MIYEAVKLEAWQGALHEIIHVNEVLHPKLSRRHAPR